MTKIAVVTGNPKPQSRTHSVARAVADAIAAGLGAEPARGPDCLEIDLAEHSAGLFDWSDPALTRLTEEVVGSDIAIFASPTYKASYTGMLKAFLDRYGQQRPGGRGGRAGDDRRLARSPARRRGAPAPGARRARRHGPVPRPVRHRA
ncbi:MAG TPA: NAD(P)H-dependent oxidoreductase [Trebonia sp.]